MPISHGWNNTKMLNSLSRQRGPGIRVSGEKCFGGEASQCFLKGSRYPRATVKIIVAQEHLQKFERAVETCRDVAACKCPQTIQKLAACRHKHAKIERTLGRRLRGDASWVTDSVFTARVQDCYVRVGKKRGREMIRCYKEVLAFCEKGSYPHGRVFKWRRM